MRWFFLFAAAALAVLAGTPASTAPADRFNASGVEYMNIDPSGRLRILEQEAELVAARAAAMNQRVGRDMIIRIIMQAAAEEGMDPALLLATAMAESRLDPFAVSSHGAIGIMQLMPQTARTWGCQNPYDIYQNVRGGARYLKFLMDRYNGDLRLAIAAYNAGPAPVDRLSDIPPFSETQFFVTRVMRYMDEILLELP